MANKNFAIGKSLFCYITDTFMQMLKNIVTIDNTSNMRYIPYCKYCSYNKQRSSAGK